MKPTPEQIRIGALALQAATEHRSVKRDPEAAVAAVYEAMTADHLMPASPPAKPRRPRAPTRKPA